MEVDVELVQPYAERQLRGTPVFQFEMVLGHVLAQMDAAALPEEMSNKGARQDQYESQMETHREKFLRDASLDEVDKPCNGNYCP